MSDEERLSFDPVQESGEIVQLSEYQSAAPRDTAHTNGYDTRKPSADHIERWKELVDASKKRDRRITTMRVSTQANGGDFKK